MSNTNFTGPGGTVYTTIQESMAGKLGLAKLQNGRLRIRLQLAEGYRLDPDNEYILGSAPELAKPESTNRRYSSVVDLDELPKVLQDFVEAFEELEAEPEPEPEPEEVAGPAATVKGTTGSTYEVVATRPDGVVIAKRYLGDHRVRIRVIPPVGKTLPLSGWSQPEGYNWRYSKVVPVALLNSTVLEALVA